MRVGGLVSGVLDANVIAESGDWPGDLDLPIRSGADERTDGRAEVDAGVQAKDVKDGVKTESEQRGDRSALDGREDAADAGRAAVAQGWRGRLQFSAGLFGRLRIEATKGAVTPLERIAIDSDRASVQADVDDVAARFGLIAELGLEQNAQGLVGLHRRAQVGEPADELDGFADGRVRHPATDAGAIDSVRDREMRRRHWVPEGIVEQVRRYDRLGGLLVPAIVLGGDSHDVLAVFEDADLLDPILAGRVKRAHGQRHALRRQRLDMGGRILRGALDHTGAVLAIAVGNQEIADGVRRQRLQDRFLQLRLPARSALIDLKLVAVRAGQKLALGVSGRVGAAVIVRAIVGLVLSGGHLRRVHRQLYRERLGFLAGLLELPHVAAGGREQSRIDKKGLRWNLRRLLA